MVQGGDVAFGGGDADAEQVTQPAGVTARGMGFIQDSIFADRLDGSDDAGLQPDPPAADRIRAGRRLTGKESGAGWRCAASACFDSRDRWQDAPGPEPASTTTRPSMCSPPSRTSVRRRLRSLALRSPQRKRPRRPAQREQDQRRLGRRGAHPDRPVAARPEPRNRWGRGQSGR